LPANLILLKDIVTSFLMWISIFRSYWQPTSRCCRWSGILYSSARNCCLAFW